MTITAVMIAITTIVSDKSFIRNDRRWGLMTITTVGYDLSPKTFLGKLIGNVHIIYKL